jgi:hypothetical protein
MRFARSRRCVSSSNSSNAMLLLPPSPFTSGSVDFLDRLAFFLDFFWLAVLDAFVAATFTVEDDADTADVDGPVSPELCVDAKEGLGVRGEAMGGQGDPSAASRHSVASERIICPCWSYPSNFPCRVRPSESRMRSAALSLIHSRICAGPGAHSVSFSTSK